jgi:hypothetical protein
VRETKSPATRAQGTARVDVVFSDIEIVQVELKANAGTNDVLVRVLSAHGEEWEQVADEQVRRGIELLLQRESRLERTAAQYGMEADALLRSLEQSVVDIADESAGIPEAERDALAAAGISLEGSPQDPTGASEVLRGLARFARFREDALTVTEVASLLGRTDGRVRQMVSAGQLATIPNGESGYLLPSWQFVGNQPIPGLAPVLEALATIHPLTVAGFMTRANVDLEVDANPATPVQWLLSGGGAERVADLASGLGALA